jgi:hypothetical protein
MVKLMMTDAEVMAAIEETQARLRVGKSTRAALAVPKPKPKPTYTERLRAHRGEPPEAAPLPLPTKPHSHFVEAALEASKPVPLTEDDANAGADMEAARLKAFNVGKLQALMASARWCPTQRSGALRNAPWPKATRPPLAQSPHGASRASCALA